MRAETSTPPSRATYFVGPWVDYTLIGAASIGIFFFLPFTLGWNHLFISESLKWICNWPHFFASYSRLYHSKESIQRYPVTALVVPFVVMGGMAACLLHPTTIAPTIVKLMILWSGIHYAGQTLGITLIYSFRSGLHLAKGDRRLLSALAYAILIPPLIGAKDSISYWGIPIPHFSVPSYLLTSSHAIVFLLAAAFVIRWVFHYRRTAGITFIPMATHFLWYAIAPGSTYYLYVPFFHGAQYLIVAWSAHSRQTRGDRIAFAKWFLLHIVGGACVWLGLPKLMTLSGYPTDLVYGVTFAWLQIHHFMVDGVIWKLRHPSVRKALIPSISQPALAMT